MNYVIREQNTLRMPVCFGDLERKDFFCWGGQLYQMFAYNSAFNLNKGRISHFRDDDQVTKVEVEINWKRV